MRCDKQGKGEMYCRKCCDRKGRELVCEIVVWRSEEKDK